MIYRLTKSKYIFGLQCEKALYLDVYKPQLAFFPPETLNRFRKGREFESKIKALFPNAIDLSQQLRGSIQKYPELTQQILMQSGEANIYEAGFVYNEVLLLADVVHKDTDGNISVYEIKNSLTVKDVFRNDVGIQHYVIANSLNIIFGEPRLESFKIIYNDGNGNPLYEEMIHAARDAEPLVANNIERFKEILQGFEPTTAMGEHCNTPYECPYKKYCEGRITSQAQLQMS